MRMVKDGRNQMLDANRRLSEAARKAIAGLMKLAPALTAFGNTNPTSYFRLVPHQEAPTNVCWGDRNRSVLVRVPLGWTADGDMCSLANPYESATADRLIDTTQKQTVEIRNADGSANIYQLLAGLAVALRHGFELDDALEVAEKTYVDVNIHSEENAGRLATLDSLPVDCAGSADQLQLARKVFESRNVFEPAMIDAIIAQLRSYDSELIAKAKNDTGVMLDIVKKYFHCG
jgi:glutamine synthetase